jgi:photosystem II stability/assembly factor-like uncharacterized protein
MARILLLVGTRKGCFVLEADAGGGGWRVRGPLCESWPVYHAVYEPASGVIYAAAASEWHGSAVWRSGDLGETWALSSEGLAYEEAGVRRVSKLSTLAATEGRVLVGAEAPGVFESRDGGESWSLLTTLAGQPGSEGWDDPANQPPGHLGVSGITPDAADSSRLWAIVQGVGLFETGDGGESWRRLDRGLPQRDAHLGVLRAALAIDAEEVPGLYFGTSTGQVFASADEGENWSEIARYLPPVWSVEVAVIE